MKRIDLLINSAEELKRRVEIHQSLLNRTITDGSEAEMDSVRFYDCSRCRSLREILAEAIDVIEGTRKSFKSKQLEMIRKKMIRVMVDSH